MAISTKLRICTLVFIMGLVNFAVFMAAAIYLGGDAVNGKVENGHYYLMNHGSHTEVTKAIFTYSRWHVYSVLVTHPSAIVAAFWYNRLRKLQGTGAKAD